MRLISFLFLLTALSAHAERPTYPLEYHVTLNPEHDRAEVVIESDHEGLLELLDFNIGSGRYSHFDGNGELEVNDERAVWRPPEDEPARLSFHATLSHERDPGEYDALMTEDWALFRGDNVIPPARSKARDRAAAVAWLTFSLPEHWTSVTTGWDKRSDRRFRIDNPERRFDRPTGWMLAGRLGTRRETLGETDFVVSAPKGSSLRRMDVVAMVTNVWPEIEKAFETTPPKFAVIGHGDPLWRGALSGPNALFLHGDRPLVSENGTSTLIHELIHVVTRIDSDQRNDWIVEGLAEFYAVELMYRAGAFTDARRKRIFDGLADWGEEADCLRTGRSSAEVTARAAVLFEALDRDIKEATDGKQNLDAVTRLLIEKRAVTLDDLRAAVQSVMGEVPSTLETSLLETG